MLMFGEIATNVPACGSASALVSKGVWYYIVGASKTYTLSTEASRNLDTQISIFEGACSQLQCVAGNDDDQYTYDGHSYVQFVGRVGVKYSILVHAANEDAIGSYNLKVTEHVENDIMNCAIELNVTKQETSIVGSTVNATVDELEGVPFDAPLPSSPGVWYRIRGMNAQVS